MPFSEKPYINLVANTFGSASTNETEGGEFTHSDSAVTDGDLRQQGGASLQDLISEVKERYDKHEEMIRGLQKTYDSLFDMCLEIRQRVQGISDKISGKLPEHDNEISLFPPPQKRPKLQCASTPALSIYDSMINMPPPSERFLSNPYASNPHSFNFQPNFHFSRPPPSDDDGDFLLSCKESLGPGSFL